MVYILLLLMDLKNIELSLIVGINKKRGIGLNGTMPWYFPEDLKYFQRLTKTTIDPNKKNIVLMGRNTMNSIPKFPLKNRMNVCISTTLSKENETQEYIIYRSLDEAINELQERDDIEKIFIIGGAMLYSDCLKHKNMKHLYLNELNDDQECDTFFPIINMNDYKQVERTVLSPNVIANHYEKK